jgi:hypothetical protein
MSLQPLDAAVGSAFCHVCCTLAQGGEGAAAIVEAVDADAAAAAATAAADLLQSAAAAENKQPAASAVDVLDKSVQGQCLTPAAGAQDEEHGFVVSAAEQIPVQQNEEEVAQQPLSLGVTDGGGDCGTPDGEDMEAQQQKPQQQQEEVQPAAAEGEEQQQEDESGFTGQEQPDQQQEDHEQLGEDRVEPPPDAAVNGQNAPEPEWSSACSSADNDDGC